MFRLSRYFVVLSTVWMIAMTWRIYPQFGDTLRADGHLITFDAYIEETCGQRIGPEAASCLEEARATGHRLLAREQARSVLFILALPLGYLALYLPPRFIIDQLARRARSLRGPPRSGGNGSMVVPDGSMNESMHR